MSPPYAHDLPAVSREVKNARGCHGIVTRDGVMDACEKPAVTLVDARDLEDGCYWPACAYHANRYGRGQCVPLSVMLLAAGRSEDADQGEDQDTH